MNTTQAVAFFGVSKRTLERLRAAGRLKGAVVTIDSGRGGHRLIRYDRNACQKLIESWTKR